MKKFYPLFLLILTIAPVLSIADPIDKVASLVRQGNVHELAGLFAESVDISILGDDNTYSKVQAELILDKFFSQNKPRAVKMQHKVNSNPSYRYGVLIMNTEKATYRITFTLKDADGKSAIIEFRIETEKVK
jgi:hypothetical protein